MNPKTTPTFSPGAPDPALLDKLILVKRAYLALVVSIAGIAFCSYIMSTVGESLLGGWQLMNAGTALALLLLAFGFEFSEAKHSSAMFILSVLFAIIVVVLAGSTAINNAVHSSQGLENLPAFREQSTSFFPYRFSTQIPIALTLFGLSIILSRTKQRIADIFSDLIVMTLCLLTLIHTSGYIFAGMRLFGATTNTRIAPQVLLCLFLLTAVALLRRAECGVFSIFLGRGIGSRIARGLTPILLLLPFLRELGRAHLIQALRIPDQYVTAILASIATIVSFVLLLFLAWRINHMEAEIQDLSLRDELTGLCNLRGFHLLAEQTLRLARRSQLPISVLFIDVDDLKGINDSLGHAAGSAFLVETADLMRDAFRETDVMGRTGGDEFVVVCQCSHVAASIATERLKAAAVERNTNASRKLPLSFSVGYVTAEEPGQQTLKELLTQADQAMYADKKLKKQPAIARQNPPAVNPQIKPEVLD